MAATRQRAQVVHAIAGRLRLRFDGREPLADDGALAALRLIPGVLSTDLKPTARSAIVRYVPAVISEQAVLAELGRAGIDVTDRRHEPDAASTPASERGDAAPSPQPTPHGRGSQKTSADDTRTQNQGSGTRSALFEALIGPPPKLDRRFAESLGLSAVSLLAARRIGQTLGGGTTIPAYFAVWFALRRLTGAGRRR